MKLIVLYCAVCALLLGTVTAKALVENDGEVQQTTESPIADMVLLDTIAGDMQTDSINADAMNTSHKEKVMADSQQHTIADFIIHPLIALKPHAQEGEGKQADTSSTTPSPWQLFGFNAGQGLGSQVSSLAGSVTGWLGNRIQLPGLVDTPVRESTTTTTTTTTPKPDVVVRVKQRGPTKKPLISIKGDNERPYHKTKRPNKFNNWAEEDDEDFDDEEDEEEEVFNNNKRKKYQNNNHDDDDDEEEDEDDEDSNVNNNGHDSEDEDNEVADNSDDEQDDEAEEEEEVEEEPPKPIKQNQRRRHPRPLNNRRRINHNQTNNQRKRFNNNNNNSNTSRKQQQQQQRRKPYQESDEIEQDDEDEEHDEAEAESESEQQQDFYYHKNPSAKRSKTEQNFIQRGQETLIKQIQQFTGGQTPAEVTQTMRKNKKSGNKKQRNQATLIIKRNGQAIYVAPELLQVTDALSGNGKPAGQHISVTSNQVKKPSHYPQPPLTVPYKRKGKPAQYITIPWSQLGISPPDDLTALTNGIQTQPLILNIPQSAIDSMQYPKAGKRKQIITPEAVPLLADASIMDIFKPPRIPPARTPSTTTKPRVTAQGHGPVLIATKTGPTRIRPATIVEIAPADQSTDANETSEESLEYEASPQLIVIGDETGERQLTHNEYRKILEFFNERTGRQLNDQQEQLIPVKVINAAEDNATTEVNKIDNKMQTEMENVPEIPVDESLKQESRMVMEMENVTEISVDDSLKQESGMEMENVTEIPVDDSLKEESDVEDITESVVENATESPVNV